MFKAHPFEGRYRSAGLGALVAAKAVHQERNRVVHDMWIPSIGPDRTVVDPETFARQRLRRKDDFGKVEMKTLDDVAEVVEQLERAQFRISSLVFSPPLFPAGGRGEPTEEDLRMIEGRFDLEDGGARTHTD